MANTQKAGAGRRNSNAPRNVVSVMAAVAVLTILFTLSGCALPAAQNSDGNVTPPAGAAGATDTAADNKGEATTEGNTEGETMALDPNKKYVATIATDKGDIVIELNAEVAPKTVANFVKLSRDGFYDGLTFHRVEPGFVAQGGDPAGNGTGGPGYTVPAEISTLKHLTGTVATARQGDQVNPDRKSSGSQFYICLAPAPFLDNAYTIFGQVSEGMDVVQKIAVGDVMRKVTIEER
jgi:cyclophilin family peptidyl-prolyl cis-trans isomerase